jgi:PST family polysaccharide transporter
MTAEGVEFVLRLVSIAVLARLLVPEYFGLVAMVTAITTIAEQFKDLGLSLATVQRRFIDHHLVSTLFWINVSAGIGITLIICALAVPIAHFYNEPRLVPVCIVLSTSFLFGGATIQHQALLRRKMYFGRLASVHIASSICSVLVAIALALYGAGYWALVVREMSRAVFVFVGTWICMPWIPGRPSTHEKVRSMLAFGGDIAVFNLIYHFTSNLDQIVVGKIFGAMPLGLYRQGVSLALGPITQLTFPISTVAESALSQLQDAKVRYRAYFQRFVTILAALSMPIAAFVAVFAQDIVLVVLGERWAAATPFLRILAIAAIARPAAGAVGFVMITTGRSRRYLYWGMWRAALLVAFISVGAEWGPEGIAWSQVATTYVPMIPFLYWGLKGSAVSVGDFFSAVKVPLVACLAMIVVTEWYRATTQVEPVLLRLVIGFLVGFAVYFATWCILPSGRTILVRAVSYALSMVRGRAWSR